ncbi:MAG: hypothetical protein ACM3QS_07215 [Bacteroidota bacterium]
MKKALKIVIWTVMASLLLTTTAFAASANSKAKTDLMKELHTKNPLSTAVLSGMVISYQPGVSITIRTRGDREITIDLSKATKILPASSSVVAYSRVMVFAVRDRGERGLSGFLIVDLRAPASAPAANSPSSTATPAPSPTPSPTPAK